MEKENKQIQEVRKSTAEKVINITPKFLFGCVLSTLAVGVFSLTIASFMLVFSAILFLVLYPVFLLSLIVYWKLFQRKPIPSWFKNNIEFNGNYAYSFGSNINKSSSFTSYDNKNHNSHNSNSFFARRDYSHSSSTISKQITNPQYSNLPFNIFHKR